MSTILEARSRYHQPDDIDPITAGADEPDFSAEQASEMIDKIFAIGHQRKEQLDKAVKQRSDGSYAIDDAHIGQYGDFHNRANYEYLQKKYPWLHTFNETIGIDDDKAEETHGDLETFLASVPHEDWESFITDVEGLDDDPILDEDRASELEMEEASRWMTEDGGPDLINSMVENCPDVYEAYLLSKATPDLIWEWSRETDHYPESQGQGDVWMNMEELGKDRENQEWFLDKIEDDVPGWTAIKRAFYDEGGGEKFDLMLRQLAGENEQVAATFNRIDGETLWQMFLQAFPDERRENDDPYWYRWRQNYSEPYSWKVGFEPGRESPQHWQHGYTEALEQLKVTPWFLKLIGSWFDRGPENHPESKFEHLNEAGEADPDDPETFMRYGGGLAEEVVYEDDKIVVMYPRDFQTLNYHLRLMGLPEIDKQRWDMQFKYRDIFVFLGKERPDLVGHAGKRELGVVYGSAEDGLHVYNGSSSQPDLNRLTGDVEYGKSIQRCLLLAFREQVERDEKAAKVLMQLGGIPELKRAERRGHLNLDNFRVPMGFYYIKKHKYALAAKAFGRWPQTVTPKGVWLIYDDVSDLTGVFKNSDAASTVFAHDHYDWFDHYYEKHNKPEVKDVVPFLDPKAIEHIRSVMVNRRVFFPDGGPDEKGEYVTLNKKLIDAYDDDTLMGWMENPSDEDKEDGVWDDIIEAIQLAGVDILMSALQDAVHTGFVEAAVNAIDGRQHKWGTHPTKRYKSGEKGESFEVFVPWHSVEAWLDTYAEHNNDTYSGSLEDLALEANRDTVEPDVSNMEAGWRDVNKDWAKENLQRIYDLEPPEVYQDPNQTELSLGEGEDEDTQHLLKQYGLENPDYALAKAEKEADAKGHTQQSKKDVARAFLRKKQEALDPDDPEENIPRLLTGVPLEFEQQVKAILRDSGEANGYTARDLKFQFEPSQQHSEEDIDASDGRLYNRYPAHQILLIIYRTEPHADWSATQKVFASVGRAVINTFQQHNVLDGHILNPVALEDELPDDLTIFQFHLHEANPQALEPAGQAPF